MLKYLINCDPFLSWFQHPFDQVLAEETDWLHLGNYISRYVLLKVYLSLAMVLRIYLLSSPSNGGTPVTKM